MIRTKGVVGLFRALSLMLLCVLGSKASAQVFDIYEGYGVLENGWYSNSTAAVNLQSTTHVIENNYGCQVTYGAGGQNFLLNFDAGFTSKYLQYVLLYINEGATVGRTVNVSITANGVQSAAVSMNNYIVGTVTANAWVPVIIPLTAFGVAQTAPVTISAISFQEAAGTTQPAYWIGYMGWLAFTAPNPVTITANPSIASKTVDQKMFGVNTAVWDSGFAGYLCQNLISRGNFQAFRFPGGSLADTYNWQTNTTGTNTWTWATSFDAFASSVAVRNAKGQGFITANYGTGTPAEAAAWVQYSNITKQYGMKYWEIGNEVYGTWETDSHTKPNDPVTYAQQFALYYNAMKAVDPTIKIGAVAVPGEDAYVNYPAEVVTNPVTHVTHSGWTPVMLSTLAGLGVTPDYLIYHNYPEYNIDCDYTLLTGNGVWAATMSNLRLQLNQYLGTTKAAPVQLMCTENNADAGTPGKQLTSLTNGLYMADSFGQLLQTECNSYMWWDLINGQGTNSADGNWLYGWRTVGDEGMFSPDFTQTYPIYYTEQLVNQFAAPGDSVAPTTSSYGMLTAYTTTRSDGTVRMMVVNLAVNQNITARISLTGGYLPAKTATTYTYGMNEDNTAKGGGWQSLTVSSVSGISTTSTMTFPSYSTTVIVFTPLKVHPITPVNPVNPIHPNPSATSQK